MSGRGKNKFLAILVLSAFSFLCVAEETIAIIGDSVETQKVADLVSSSLSKQYSLIERTELEKLLKERKLSAAGIGAKEIIEISPMIHADYFITINSAESNKKTIPSRLLIFDARNGFRLLDSHLPDDTENAAEYSVREIRKTLAAAHDTKDKKFLSVLSIRNAGVPQKHEPDLANIALEVERNLSKSPNVELLERDNLGMVNLERKLSESFSKLTASAYLLDFEFLPGPTEGHVNLSLNILDSSGKKLSQIKIDDCLKYPPKTIETALSELSQFLSLPLPANTVSGKEEAKRFFNEYKFARRVGELGNAERKLQAAIALDPNVPQYRFELAYLQPEKVRYSETEEKNINNFIDAGNRALDIIDETLERFPDCPKKNYHCYFEKIDRRENDILNYKKNFSPETKKKMDEFGERYRKCHDGQARYYEKFDLSDGINSLKEMKNFHNYNAITNRYLYFFDDKKATAILLTKAMDELNISAEFLKKNQELLKKISYEEQFLIFIPEASCLLPEALSENFVKNSESLSSAAMEHPSPAVRAYGLNLDLFRKTIISNYDPEEFSQNADIMFQEFDKLEIASFPDHGTIFPYMPRDLHIHRKIDKIYSRKQIEYLRETKRPVKWRLISSYLYAYTYSDENPGDLAKEIEFLEPELTALKNSKDIYPHFRRDTSYAFRKWAERLPPEKPQYEKALRILEIPGNVKAEILLNNESFPEYSHATAIQEADGKVYILESVGSYYHIYELDPQTEKISLAAHTEKSFYSSNRSFGDNPFAVSKKYFLIGGEKVILVIPRNGQSPYFIENLPEKYLNSLTILDERIYAISSKILYSMLPDGSDRKIHISTMRTDKKCSLDKTLPFHMPNLIADPMKKRILITVNNDKIDGLWELSIKTGETKQLIAFDRNTYESSVLQVGNMLYIGNRLFGSNYTFDMATNNMDFVYLSRNTSSLKYLKGPKPRYVHDLAIDPPFFCREKQLWFGGGYSIVFVNPEKLLYPEYIRLELKHPPNLTFFYPHPDGVSVYAFSGKNIYKLTPKNID